METDSAASQPGMTPDPQSQPQSPVQPARSEPPSPAAIPGAALAGEFMSNENPNPISIPAQPEHLPPQPVAPPQPPAPVQTTSGEYAGFGRRFLASLIDGLIVGLAGFFVMFLFSVAIGTAADSTPETTLLYTVLQVLMNLVLIAINTAYVVYFTGHDGQTIGKKLMKIKVVLINTDTHPTYLTAFLRDVLGKIISLFLFGLGYFWMLWDENRQTWHDKIAGTAVVRV